MTERQCRFCKELLSLDSFYASDKWKCKKCRKALTKKNRADKPDHYKAFDRNRSHTPERVEARKQYQQTDVFKIKTARAKAKYIEHNPIKRKAHTAVRKALLSGELVKQPCIICSDLNSHGHHEDYDRPLDVTWLCDKHHKARHVQLREYERLGTDPPDVSNIPF